MFEIPTSFSSGLPALHARADRRCARLVARVGHRIEARVRRVAKVGCR